MTPSTNTNNFRALFYSEALFNCTDVSGCVSRVISSRLPVNVSVEACSLNVWQSLMNSVCVPQAPSNITLCSILAVVLNIVWDAGYLTAGLNWTPWSHAGGFQIYQTYEWMHTTHVRHSVSWWIRPPNYWAQMFPYIPISPSWAASGACNQDLRRVNNSLVRPGRTPNTSRVQRFQHHHSGFNLY